MKMLHAGMLALGVSMLVGCGTTGTTSSASSTASAPVPVAGQALPQSVATNGDTSETSGLGQIVYSGRDVIDCGRTRRTGSRIPRDVCRPSSFNGLFPSGGINMGTAREGQPSYGNR